MKFNSAIYPVFLSGLLFIPLIYSCKKETIKVIPTVKVITITDLTATSATSGGEVTSDGGAAVTSRGVCWSTIQNPTTSNNKTNNGTGSGSFTSSITGLTPGTSYNIRAFAINEVGTAYSSQSTFTTLSLEPALTTTTLTSVTSTSVSTGGNITSDGGASVTARGVCWSTNQNPTISDNKTSDGTGSGSFTSPITGLTPGATYYFRAYATNSAGTAYGNQLSTATTAVLPILTTATLTSITSTSLSSGGNITSDGGAAVTARGVCWSTNQNPTISDSKTSDGTGSGSFTSSITGLTPGATYYFRAYATNSAGTAYGNQLSTATSAVLPILTTTTLTSITSTSLSTGGNITSDGGASVTARGVCWSTNQNPTISDNKTSDGTGSGSFTSPITGLTPGATYYFRAYATNSAGTAYGNQLSTATTAVLPILTTATLTSITSTSLSSGGNITSDGGAAVTARGVCWSTNQNPTISDSKTSDGTGSGSFTSSITGLTPGATYYFRAYATNSAGTAYGNQLSTATTAVLPILTTATLTSITSTSLSSGGNITSDGGAAVTSRGVCWSTNQNPTISDSKTSDGTGSGSFTSSITGLTPGVTYYFRAYATNSAGTAYGNQLSTATTAVLPILTTTTLTSITSTSLSSGGNISSDGGAAITARGVCWSTSQNPTIANYNTYDGTGTGSFTSSITGLTPGATYYFRAYATNSVGTAYGDQLNTTTPTALATLVTYSVSSIKATTAASGGNITSDGGSAVTARGVCWNTSSNPTIVDNKTSDGTGTGSYVSNLTGLTENTTYYLRAYATNTGGTAYGSELVFKTTVADKDGNLYHTVTIGNGAQAQVWMVENLLTTKYNDGTNIPNATTNGAWSVPTPGYCWYNNISSNQYIYGALYNWYTVNTGKLCPAGWHVPTDTDWTVLTTFLGGESVAGGKLKETGTTHWLTPNTGATNDTGFSGLPGGSRAVTGTFGLLGSKGNWWSSTLNSTNAYFRPLSYDGTNMPQSSDAKGVGYSVRCLRD